MAKSTDSSKSNPTEEKKSTASKSSSAKTTGTDPVKSAWEYISSFFVNVLSIKRGTDRKATVEGIQKDIVFRGPTAWILMFSILIASIGLNVNSIAVIIGAMLISPLMGPILGIGLSLGTNDWQTLLKSLKNLGIAVFISLVTSGVYFALTPLDYAQSELLNRTRPTILDVMVALFGGFAGIIAGSRREKSNVVPGVAIATALMPPLCTAGYGLATLQFNYFFGASYLFFINSVFIALSTYLVVRYLHFPKVEYMDKIKGRRYRWIVTFFLVITILPSVWIFWQVILETRYTIRAENFINEKCHFEGSELISKKINYNDTLSVIDLYFIGSQVDNDEILYLHSLLPKYGISGKEKFPVTKKTKIVVHQERDDSDVIQQRFQDMNEQLRLTLLEDIYTKNQALIKDKDAKISLLEKELFRLKTKDMIPMDQLKNEINFHFKNIEKFSYANAMEITGEDTTRIDTISSLLIHFKPNIRSSTKKKDKKQIREWFSVRFGKDTVQVVEY